MSSVLGLQSDVARMIADQIQIKLTPQEQARLTRAQTIDPKAQDFYFKGMQFLNQGDPAKATEYFKEAIERYPNYAQAHAELADCYRWMVGDGAMPSSEGFALQKSEAVQAAKLDEALPQAHVELAYAAMNSNWDWKTQGNEFKRALELDPNSAPTHWAYAGYLERTGQIPEAIAECNFALQLDPASSRTYLNAAFLYYFARQYDKALAQIKRASELHIDPAETRFPLGTIYAEMGLYNEAIWQFQQLGSARHALGHMGNAYARQGNIVAARQMIAQLEDQRRKDNAGSYEIAQIYAGLGEKDQAFAWLENAYNVRDEGLTYIKIDPCLDPLRSDPRFQALLLRVGFRST
jgi:tetratricopeptide (TPR) repeat protein